MRQTPGFVAYYFLDTADGVATITITEDELLDYQSRRTDETPAIVTNWGSRAGGHPLGRDGTRSGW